MRSLIVLSVLAGLFVGTPAHAQGVDWKQVDGIFNRTAAVTGDVHRYGFPRSDLAVTLDGVTIKPALALGGWVAFMPSHDGVAMAMGDLVLLEPEVSPVMSKMIEGGLQVTAVHNHLLRANPETFYLHIAGHGDASKIATAIRDALAVSKTPLTAQKAATTSSVDLDTGQIDQIMGAKGKLSGGVYQVAVQRGDKISEQGMQLSPAGPLGLATGINFQPTGNGKAAITGDFVLIGSEVNPVIHALKSNGIEVTAVHSHMLDEQPRLFFLHFWANDDALKLAKGLRAALDETRTAAGESAH
jgi:hypothetical protein